MDKLKIQQGSKLSIAVGDSGDFTLRSTFEKNLNAISFLISVPISNGKRLQVDEFQKLQIKYEISDSSYIVEGFVDDCVKHGVRNYWKIRKVSENREFFSRSSERVKIGLDIKVGKRWWSPQGVDSLEELDALTLDISAGGLAMFMDITLSVGEVVEVTLPSQGKKKEVHVKAETCWVRQTERGNAYRQIIGLRFIFMDAKERGKVEKYVSGLVASEE